MSVTAIRGLLVRALKELKNYLVSEDKLFLKKLVTVAHSVTYVNVMQKVVNKFCLLDIQTLQ